MLLWLWLGCARETPLADADLNQVLLDLFTDYEDPVARAAHAQVFDDWLHENADDELYWDGVQVENLGEAQLGSLIDYSVDYSAHRGVATAYLSEYPALEHAKLASRADQTWTDPAFDRYVRTVIEGTSASFSTGGGPLLTMNDIIRSGAFGISIPYTLRKDYYWVAVEGGQALLSRWWLVEPGCSDNGKNCVEQSAGLEIYAPRRGGSQRFICNWIQTVTQADGLLSEDGMLHLIAEGNQDLMTETDAYLSEL